MKIINQSLVDKFIDTVNQISVGDKIALFYDPDGDGTCASVLLQKALERLNKRVVYISNEFHGSVIFTEKIIEILRAHGITHVFTLDLPVDHTLHNFELLSPFTTIIIDHHPTRNVNHPRNVLLMKPAFFTDMKEPSYYCTSKLVYDLMLRLVNITDLKWLAISGLVADYCWKDWDEFLRKGFAEYGFVWKDYLYDTELGMLGKLISGAAAFLDNNRSAAECRRLLAASQDLGDALQKLEQFGTVNKRVDEYIVHFAERAESYAGDQLMILEHTEPYNINSPIATGVSTKQYPHKFILIVQDRGDVMKLSARSSNHSWNTDKLLQECTRGFENCSVGGHAPSSGGFVQKKDYPEFKKRIIAAIEKTGKIRPADLRV